MTSRPTARPSRRRAAALLLGPAVTAMLLAGCSGAEDQPAPSGSAAPTSANGTTPAISDAWVKVTDGDMTAIFGTLTNPTASDVTVTGGVTQSATSVELHEVAMVDGAMTMRPKAGGFVIPAKGSLQLAPGKEHLMLMGLTNPIKAGDSIAVTLNLSDGSSISFSAIGKATNAGAETYEPTSSK
ncbi:MAG: copper chaperone PCu(A)C [Kineosporiaceae bacterium]